MNLLALDISTKTGFSIWEDGKLVKYGLKEFKTTKGKDPASRYWDFYFWLTMIINYENITHAACEIPHLRGMGSSLILVGFYTRVLELAATYKLPLRSIHTATLKKSVTGNGKAEKKDIIAWARKFTGDANLSDDNICDSLACGWTALNIPEKIKAKKVRKVRKAKEVLP